MPDIELRFNKDVLVMSNPVDLALSKQGVDIEQDIEFVFLIEPEALVKHLRLQVQSGAQCLVMPTKSMLPSILAHHGLDQDFSEIVSSVFDISRCLSTQHLMIELGPCGLPLDASSKASLNEHRDQYARAAREFDKFDFDAFFLNGFTDTTQLKCALMGIAQVSSKVIFASVDIGEDARLNNSNETIEDAIAVMSEYGASVCGFSCGGAPEVLCDIAKRTLCTSTSPLLVQIDIKQDDIKCARSINDNPYYYSDTMINVAQMLCANGVQFLRAIGDASAAYTATLAAATLGMHVSI